ncbi:MAG: (Fe-S)-binding protein [Erysipelotrichaceae bacterium]|nr:(Fe-S)-binding protein [Erysipelotrichaceae bacterium]
MLSAMLVMLVIGAVLGAILSIASVVFHVEVDKREEAVTSMLPGYNCGACGYPGCSGLAHSMVEGEVTTFNCKVAKPEKKQEIIDYLANTPGPDGNTVTIKG